MALLLKAGDEAPAGEVGVSVRAGSVVEVATTACTFSLTMFTRRATVVGWPLG